jgi:hypothetical protein
MHPMCCCTPHFCAQLLHRQEVLEAGSSVLLPCTLRHRHAQTVHVYRQTVGPGFLVL